MARSGTSYSLPRDSNRVPTLGGVSSADGVTVLPVEINPSTGELLVSSTSGTVNAANSTTAVLTANASFTGTGTSVLGYSRITVQIVSDKSSATNGVQLQFSEDNTNWTDASLFSYTAGGTAPNSGQIYGVSARGQYFRVVYTNGSTNQTSFALQTLFHTIQEPGDLVTMSTVPNSTNHALLTKSSIVGLTTGGGGGFVDVKVNPSGTLTVDASNSTGLVLGTGTANIGDVGTISAPVNVAQVTSNTTAVQLSSVSTVPTNGIIVQALKANAANVYVGGSTVTTSTGFELQPGQAISFTCNLNTLYVIGANNTDKVCYNVV